ncbi:MAG: DNA-directed RNA polymerase subunit D [Candidatus Pacearchaeota archaeon]|nr:DNA-directed RNA polymerase subunit D [Candidatus Pacearchaeota archaeon]
MVKIEKLKETKDKITFSIDGINSTIANSIRRSTFEIEVLAIDLVEFYKNDSALYDEMIALRLGLLPLKAPKSFTRRGDCSCKEKGCLKCTASFKLKAEGPGTVYSKELKAKGCDIVFEEMPLVILAKDQELELTAEAYLGSAIEHTKFLPGLVWFRSNAVINLTKDTESYTDLVNICPKRAIISKGSKIEIDSLKCDLCECCIEYCNEKNKKPLDLKASEDSFTMFIESFGQLEPKELFIESLNIIDKNLDEVAKAVKKLK